MRVISQKSIVTNLFVVLVLLAIAGCHLSKGRTFGGTHHAGSFFWDEAPRIVHKFSIFNDTNQTIRILSKYSSCSCTKSDLARAVLAPGERTSLVMEVNTPRNVSLMKPIVTLSTDYRPKPEWNFITSFYSFPRILIEPKSITLAPDRLVEAFSIYEFTNQKNPKFKKPAIQYSDPSLLIHVSDRPILEDLGGDVIRARFAGSVKVPAETTRRVSRFETSATFHAAGGDGASLLVLWENQPDIRVSPSIVHFGIVESGKSYPADITVASTSEKKFRLLGFKSGPNAASLGLRGDVGRGSRPASTHRFSLIFISNSSHNRHRRAASGAVTFDTDIEAQPTITIPWSAILRDAPEVEGVRKD